MKDLGLKVANFTLLSKSFAPSFMPGWAGAGGAAGASSSEYRSWLNFSCCHTPMRAATSTRICSARAQRCQTRVTATVRNGLKHLSTPNRSSLHFSGKACLCARATQFLNKFCTVERGIVLKYKQHCSQLENLH